MESCRHNKHIDWKIISDCGPLSNKADNVEIIDTTFSDFSKQVSRRLNIHFKPENAYKLCDIKPMLGLIMEDRIKSYSFWGFGDLDVVYGNLQACFSDSLFDRYDLISTHATRVSGHLCFLRNNEKMRNIFRRAPGWQQIIEDNRHWAFDEKNFSKLFLKHKNFPEMPRRWLNKLYKLNRSASFMEYYSTPHLRCPWLNGSRTFPEVWYLRPGNGLTTDIDGKRQFPYLHFMHWKGNVWAKIADKKLLVNVPGHKIRDGWKVTKDGFFQLCDS